VQKLAPARPIWRLVAFVFRHPWSIGLSLGSVWCFMELSGELREGELGPVDDAVADIVTAWRGHLDLPMLALTHGGGGVGMTLLAIAAILLSWRHGRRTEVLFLLISTLGTSLLNIALKLGFARDRPDVGSRYLIDAPTSFSFPSGHAMGSAGVLASVVVVAFASGLPRKYRVPVGLLAASVALGVALSRVYFGVHYPSDVLGGQLAACAWVSAVTGVFYPRLLPGEQATRQTHDTVVDIAEPDS
jgi:undecaprenyl-diphosphatase